MLARLFAERMAPKMGLNLIIENRAGASGTVGGSHLLQSPADEVQRNGELAASEWLRDE